MAIDDAGSIDVVSTDPQTGRVLLDIADHLDWVDEDRHLLMLEAKINAYISFIESGQLLESHPEAEGRQPEIHVACLHSPSVRARQFYHEASSVLAKIGITLSYRQSHFNSPSHAR